MYQPHHLPHHQPHAHKEGEGGEPGEEDKDEVDVEEEEEGEDAAEAVGDGQHLQQETMRRTHTSTFCCDSACRYCICMYGIDCDHLLGGF